jgi:hypothetical protein
MNISNSGINNGAVAHNIEQVTINNFTQSLSGQTTMLSKMIKVLATQCPSHKQKKPRHVHNYSIEEKISYNNIIKYEGLINKRSEDFSIIERVLNTIDDTIPDCKNLLLDWVNDRYLVIRGTYKQKYSEKAVNHGDEIIDDIINEFENLLFQAPELLEYNRESIENNLNRFICYCFIECKILENPYGN